MLSPCRCHPDAHEGLREIFGLAESDAVDTGEIEFKEVPYFLVARSRSQWQPEESGDINEIHIMRAGERGLVVDPDAGQPGRRQTLIPWSNVLSLSITRAGEGAGGSKAE